MLDLILYTPTVHIVPTTPMTSLENLAHLKSIILAEEQKANGSFTMELFWAYCNYNTALHASSEAYIEAEKNKSL